MRKAGCREARRLSHHHPKHNTHNHACKRAEQCACERPSCLRDADGQKVDGHGIKNRFGAAHQNGDRISDDRIGTERIKDVQRHAGSGGGGKYTHDGNRDNLGVNVERVCDGSESRAEQGKAAGASEDAHGNQKSDQRRSKLNHHFKAVLYAGEKSFVHGNLMQYAV